jgi:hypothetical protein
MMVILTVWVVPWVTIGMTLDDYSFPVRVALVLTVASALLAGVRSSDAVGIVGEGCAAWFDDTAILVE